MLLFLERPSLRCSARNTFSRLMSSGVRECMYVESSRSRCSFMDWDLRLYGCEEGQLGVLALRRNNGEGIGRKSERSSDVTGQ